MSPEAEVIQLQGRLTTQTALHIGASADRELGGGRDLPILRNPLDDMPLIPGSALRGRMSSLLRAHLARGIDPPRPAAEVSALAILFGAPYRRSVLSFWDCVPETPWVYEHRAAGLPLTCWRGEMAPPRENARFRRRELVCAGVHFVFRLTVLEREAREAGLAPGAAMETVRLGLGLLEQLGIGGATARGFGRVAFSDLACRSVAPAAAST